MKNYIWVGEGGSDTTVIESGDPKNGAYLELFRNYKEHNIDGIIFFGNNNKWESAMIAAKEYGLEFHIWKPIMICNDNKIIKEHKDWFAVNKQGYSVLDKTPYVDYYKWLCPNNDEVKLYLINMIGNFTSKNDLDGFHLDYIRYCDQYIPEGLIHNYNLEKGKYYPDYDYCYCSRCRQIFKDKHGVDPIDDLTEDQNLKWNQFRLNSISNLVGSLKEFIHLNKINISAAVFPGPKSYAEKNVRQLWDCWELNAYFPMNYHSLYNEKLEWISAMVNEERNAVGSGSFLYSGLYLENLKSNELIKAVKLSMDSGADGVCLYSDDLLNESLLRTFKEISAEYR